MARFTKTQKASGPATEVAGSVLLFSISYIKSGEERANMNKIQTFQALLCLFLATALAQPCIAMTSSADDRIIPISGKALNDEDMDVNRGGRANTTTITTVTSNQTMHSTSVGNTVNVEGNLVNGHISIGDNFGGSGIGSYVMNTGNNTTINSGVSLSVLMLQ